MLTDAQWVIIEPHCLDRSIDPRRSAWDNRFFIEAMSWIVRAGGTERDFTVVFGNGSMGFRCFYYWRNADVFKSTFDVLAGETDVECAMVDGTIIKLPCHNRGEKKRLRDSP